MRGFVNIGGEHEGGGVFCKRDFARWLVEGNCYDEDVWVRRLGHDLCVAKFVLHEMCAVRSVVLCWCASTQRGW